MMKNNKIAIIDIGSNSVRLMLTDGIFKSKSLIITKLYNGLDEKGNLSLSSMMNTLNGLKTLVERAKEFGANKVYAFATEALRRANNRQEFINLVKDTLSLNIDLLSGEKEAYVGLKGAVEQSSGGIIDIGGASTEVAFLKDNKIVYSKSAMVGAVLLYKKFGRDRNKINEFIKEKTLEFKNAVKGDYYAIGGTATSLSAIHLGLKIYDSNKTHNNVLYLDKLLEIENELYSLTFEEISNKYAVQKERAQVISGGATILVNLLQRLNLTKITVSENDNLEGYLLLGKFL